MNYVLMMEMSGGIPGGVDRDYVGISGEEAEKIMGIFAGRWRDNHHHAQLDAEVVGEV